jgi:hypothetical protein
MKRPNMRRRYAVGAVATAIAAGAIAAPVFASTSGSQTSTQTNNRAGHGRWHGAGFIGDPSQYDATVAAKLGITTAKFEAAEQAVRGSTKPPTPGATGANRAAGRTAFETALAAKLGITTAQLTAAEDAADQTLVLKNLATLVSHGVLTQAQADALTTAAGNGTFDSVLRGIEIANLTTHLQKAVKDGHLTQAQADQILANAKSAPLTGGPGFGHGFGFGGPGGPGGPHGPGGRGPWDGHGPTGRASSTSSSGSNSLMTPAA